MSYDPTKFRDANKAVFDVHKWAVSLLGAFFGVKVFFDQLEKIPAQDPFKDAQVALLVVLIVFAFLWNWSSDKELNLLLDWLDPIDYVIPTGIEEVFTALGFAAALVLMLLTATNPFSFALIFTIYSFILLVSAPKTNAEIQQAISQSRDRVDADLKVAETKERAAFYREALNVLESYYLGRRTIVRLGVILIFSVAGLYLANEWRLTKSVQLGEWTYGTFLSILIISECVIGGWRYQRDQKMRAIARKLYKYDRSQAESLPPTKLAA